MEIVSNLSIRSMLFQKYRHESKNDQVLTKNAFNRTIVLFYEASVE